MLTYIHDLKNLKEKEVNLKGWIANKRTGKGLVFIILRDGTGFVQCVVDTKNVSSSAYKHAEKLTLESAVAITGKVVEDKRQIGGHELHVTDLKVIHLAEEYPIAKKEHGPDFFTG